MGRPKKELRQALREIAEARDDIEYVSGYVRFSEKARFRCRECGHEWEVSPYHVAKGRQCPACSARRVKRMVVTKAGDADEVSEGPVSEGIHRENSYVKKISNANPGFIFFGNPKKWHDKVTAVCESCGTNMTHTAEFFRTTTSCARCGRKIGTSLMECLILCAFRSQMKDVEIKHRNKTAIGSELDIYIPSKSFAVEPGAWLYHKSDYKQSKDLEKRKACEAKGIRLITIYDTCDAGKDFGNDDILTFPFCLAQENGLVTIKSTINKMLVELDEEPVPNGGWKQIIIDAQHQSGAFTTEQFADIVADKNPDYEVVGEYVNKLTPVATRCKKHGIVFSAVPPTLRSGGGCPKCLEEIHRLSKDEFMKRMAGMHPTIEVLDEYETRATPVRCRCKECGFQWTTAAGNLLSGSGCLRCNGAPIRVTEDDLVKRLEKDHPEIGYVSGYTLVHSKAKFRCRKCGCEWETTPHKIFSGTGCPECAMASRVEQHTMTEEQFTKRIAEMYPGCTLASPYAGYYEKVTIRCAKGHLHTLQATTFINKPNLGACPECKKSMPKDDIDEETLRREYLDEGLTIDQICARHNRSHAYVDGRLVKFGIQKRPPRHPVSVSEEDLRRLYVEEKKSMAEIEAFFGCSRPTIYKLMREYGIEKRGHKK